MAFELINKVWVDPKSLKIRIETGEDSLYSTFKFEAYHEKSLVAHITIERKLLRQSDLEWADTDLGRRTNDFYFDMAKEPPVAKPSVRHQYTEKRYRGNGISGHLIVVGNEFLKEEFGTPIHSAKGFDKWIFKDPLTRVWAKLVEQGKAYEYEFYKEKRFGLY